VGNSVKRSSLSTRTLLEIIDMLRLKLELLRNYQLLNLIFSWTQSQMIHKLLKS